MLLWIRANTSQRKRRNEWTSDRKENFFLFLFPHQDIINGFTSGLSFFFFIISSKSRKFIQWTNFTLNSPWILHNSFFFSSLIFYGKIIQLNNYWAHLWIAIKRTELSTQTGGKFYLIFLQKEKKIWNVTTKLIPYLWNILLCSQSLCPFPF